MDTFNIDSDDEYFSKLPERRGGGYRSNLQGLFDDNNENPGSISLLKYTPENLKLTPSGAIETITEKKAVPKSVAAAAASVGKPGTWNTLLAKVVTGYKGAQSVGKVGVALSELQSLDTNLSAVKIIVYRSRNDILCTATLRQPNNAIIPKKVHKQNSYLQFYDDEQRYWSLNFDNVKDEQEFVAQLVKLNMAPQQINEEIARTTTTKSSDIFEDSEPETTATTTTTATTKNNKSRLISRISKVGLALPKLDARSDSAASESDGQTNDIIVTPAAMQHKKNAGIVATTTTLRTTSSPTPPTATSRVATNTAQIGSFQTIENQLMQMLCTEQRTENSELRLNISKLDFKLDRVLDKLERLSDGGGVGAAGSSNETIKAAKLKRDDEIIALEEKLLELKKENRQLNQLLQESNHKIQPVVKLQKYTAYLAQLKLDVNTGDDVNKVFETLLQHTLTLQQQNEAHERDTNELRTELDEHLNKSKLAHESVADLRVQCNELQTKNDNLTDALDKLHKEYESATLEKENALLQQEQKLLKECAKNTRIASEAQLKQTMNGLYEKLNNQLLDQLPLPQSKKILNKIAITIRDVTLESINNNKESDQIENVDANNDDDSKKQ